MTSVYKLQQVLDDPRYEGFASEGPAQFGCWSRSDDFFSVNIPERGRSWSVNRHGQDWKPVPVTGRVRKFNDYPCMNLFVPVFSARAVAVLQDLLLANGELVPLVTDVGEYHAYNLTTVIDALDPTKSDLSWLDKKQKVTAVEIRRYVFRPGCIENAAIFHIVEERMSFFVTDVFVHRVKDNNLKGFMFYKGWPLARGENWRKLAKAEDKRVKAASIGGPAAVNANSFLVRLKLKAKRATPAEEARVSALMNQLDAILVTEDVRDYYGSLEGHEYAKGECRLFLSCPDADRLAAKLLPWLNSAQWDGEIQALKRYGEYVDPNVRVAEVELSRG